MVVNFKDNKIQEEYLGNKALFLMQMKKSGFEVPDGMVLDSNTYLEIIKYNKKDKKLAELLQRLTKKNVNEISNKILKELEDLKLDPTTKQVLEKRIKKNKKYAIRSSGLKEDLENFSFAGQYATFLNIEGVEQIETKIIDCYRSMFKNTILSYLENNNISSSDLKMAVIIQEMVASEYSGICFTINPTTGNDKEMVIELGKGLGENIVSGKISPEQYYYNWYDKKVKNNKNKLLSKKKVEELGEVFIQIQEFFGYPCDIEFAIEKNKLYILQARRITKIRYSSIKDMWSTADFKDGGVSATVCTPYMWSLYEYIWEYTLRKFILDSKILKEKDLNKKLGDMFYGRCYWNMSVVKKGMSQVIGYKEREFDSEYGIKIDYEGDGTTTKITPVSIFNIIKMALAQNKILKERRANAEKYHHDLLMKYENYKEKYNSKKIKDIETTWYELTKKTYLQSESTYFWQIFINTIHQSLYKDGLLKYVNESEYLSLLGGIDNISHLLPFYEMWELSRKIREDEKAFSYWTKENTKKIKKDLSKTTNYLKEINEIIEKYGYHSDKELDVTYPCYYEEKETIINTMKEMLDLEDKYSPIEDKKIGTKKYQEILKKIESKTSKKKYQKIKNKVENMRNMLWWREEFRDISTRFYYLIRVYTLELAKYYQENKMLEEQEDIWYLKVGDIWDYQKKRKTKKDLQQIISKNKRYYNSFRNYMSENEIGSIFSDQQKAPEENKKTIRGLGANNGVVTATARVIEDYKEIDRLEKNDILITKFTDTGWTPKFAILSGIVTEYGGILCHAAIVSREYGIPAIVCCHDAMKKIKDGSIITIDGEKGTIKIEKE